MINDWSTLEMQCKEFLRPLRVLKLFKTFTVNYKIHFFIRVLPKNRRSWRKP